VEIETIHYMLLLLMLDVLILIILLVQSFVYVMDALKLLFFLLVVSNAIQTVTLIANLENLQHEPL